MCSRDALSNNGRHRTADLSGAGLVQHRWCQVMLSDAILGDRYSAIQVPARFAPSRNTGVPGFGPQITSRYVSFRDPALLWTHWKVTIVDRTSSTAPIDLCHMNHTACTDWHLHQKRSITWADRIQHSRVATTALTIPRGLPQHSSPVQLPTIAGIMHRSITRSSVSFSSLTLFGHYGHMCTMDAATEWSRPGR